MIGTPTVYRTVYWLTVFSYFRFRIVRIWLAHAAIYVSEFGGPDENHALLAERNPVDLSELQAGMSNWHCNCWKVPGAILAVLPTRRFVQLRCAIHQLISHRCMSLSDINYELIYEVVAVFPFFSYNWLHSVLRFIVDASYFARQLFQLMDQDMDRSLTFEEYLVVMSMLSWGSLDEKLQWVFNLYDSNGDGQLTTDKLTNVATSVYEMLGSYTDPPWIQDDTIKDHVTRIFSVRTQKKLCSHESILSSKIFYFYREWTVTRTVLLISRSSRSIAWTWV